MDHQHFYSNGKLLITGEYLVLDGVSALALPTKFGQDLSVASNENAEILWNSIDVDGTVWMEERFDISRIIENTSQVGDSEYLKTLLKILGAAHRLNPVFFSGQKGYQVETKLSFPRLWGLGSSSTLINNIAQWMGVDAFQLLENSFGGSGYDIACAQRNTPILFTKTTATPKIETVEFKPFFFKDLYFVYLNQKQSSKEGIARYRQYSGDLQSERIQIEAITQQLIRTTQLDAFELLLDQHETIVSSIIGLPKVKDLLFSDFEGSVKSLGAWGGDFVLVTAKKNPQAYFKAKGYDTVLSYSDLILI